ncbi:hypothetical protein [Suipraeoptans intestinalis]|uniref:hypothetical protein n=1 Tax=Suipraeoptans intestinalis TaxID=2606628 RepID=UPI0012B402D9|nr:hypothetical protein [Suipraeoptans intestinalis]MDD7770257.1 hypothetical protein [Suipraeoptans intestinalis]
MSTFMLFIGLMIMGLVLLRVGLKLGKKGRWLVILCAVILFLMGVFGVIVSLL